MNGRDRIDRFDLDDHLSRDEQVQTISDFKANLAIRHRKCDFRFDRQSATSQFIRK